MSEPTRERNKRLNVHPIELTYGVTIYKKMINGLIKDYPSTFFNREYRRERIRHILIYLFDHILKITPQEAIDTFGANEFKKHYLYQMFYCIDSFPEQNDTRIFTKLIRIAYPSVREENFQELTLWMYQQVLDGKRKKFPTNYFEGAIGEKRAELCFRYACEVILMIPKHDIPKLTREDLQKMKLRILLTLIYESMFDLITSAYPDFGPKDFD